MANPFGITEVNVPGILATYQAQQQQGIENAYRRDQMQRQAKADTRADEAYGRNESARAAIANGATPEEVIKIDPPTGFDYASHAASLDKSKREEAGKRADAVGNAAMLVSRLPAEQQPAAWDQSIDQLVGMGFSDLAPYKGKYNPQALPALIAASKEAIGHYIGAQDKDRTFTANQEERAVDNARADRADSRAAAASGREAVRFKERDKDRNALAGIYSASTKEAYTALPSGARYTAPDGTVRIKP